MRPTILFFPTSVLLGLHILVSFVAYLAYIVEYDIMIALGAGIFFVGVYATIVYRQSSTIVQRERAVNKVRASQPTENMHTLIEISLVTAGFQLLTAILAVAHVLNANFAYATLSSVAPLLLILFVASTQSYPLRVRKKVS